MGGEISNPSAIPIWWRSMKDDVVVYTKCRFWFEARTELGGDPKRVANKTLIKELDANVAG